jgi:hypothetical protein
MALRMEIYTENGRKIQCGQDYVHTYTHMRIRRGAISPIVSPFIVSLLFCPVLFRRRTIKGRDAT